jgi:hypothetical protein
MPHNHQNDKSTLKGVDFTTVKFSAEELNHRYLLFLKTKIHPLFQACQKLEAAAKLDQLIRNNAHTGEKPIRSDKVYCRSPRTLLCIINLSTSNHRADVCR